MGSSRYLDQDWNLVPLCIACHDKIQQDIQLMRKWQRWADERKTKAEGRTG
jgi:hypothetical protein